MFEIRPKSRLRMALVIAIVLAFVFPSGSVRAAGSSGVQEGEKGLDLWDSGKYIGIDEVEPGMESYCLTEYGQAGIEKFGLEVVDIVPDFNPGMDVILVKGTDERFAYPGTVAGCSGSPVYIEGRLAGALAYGWQFSKDALYGVTPIKYMLQIGQGSGSSSPMTQTYDFSKPISLAAVEKQAAGFMVAGVRGAMGATALPCPLVTSGFSAKAREDLDSAVSGLGFIVVPGSGGRMSSSVQVGQGSGGGESDARQLVPGACLAVPLVTGDIVAGTYGTVTEVRGESVYGFGHPFLGYGELDLPLATGEVHTVVSSLLRSHKLCSVGRVVGALRSDEGAGILGQLGAEARTIAMVVNVDRYNDTQKRTYHCQVANNRIMTPTMIASVISSTILYLGELPPDHTIRYKGSIAVEGFEPIRFENISASSDVSELVMDTMASVRLLLINPYKEVHLTSLEFDIVVTDESIVSQIWSVDMSDSTVKAGETVKVAVVVERARGVKKRYEIPIEIPDNLKPGRYELMVSGSRDYEQFLLKAVPYRFIAQNIEDLVETLGQALQVDRDGLYLILSLPSGGVAVDKAELPDLPGTKALVLQSTKRAMSIRPYPHWIEKTVKTGTVVVNRTVLRITVEK